MAAIFMASYTTRWDTTEGQAELAMMRDSGALPEWRQDMASLAEENSDLRWKLSRTKVQQDQPSLFGED